MAKNRNVQTLIRGWNSIKDDNELVAFIDAMTMTEAKVLEKAIQQGLVNREPAYMTNEVVE